MSKTTEGNILWGIPTTGRSKKQELFNTPVVEMSSLTGDGKSQGRKFTFNKAAVEGLGLVTEDEGTQMYVAFGFVGGNIFVMATTDEDSPGAFKLSKTFTFSDKKTFEHITKSRGLSNVSENYLHIGEVADEPYYEVNDISNAGSGSTSTNGVTETSDDLNTEESSQTEGDEGKAVVPEILDENGEAAGMMHGDDIPEKSRPAVQNIEGEAAEQVTIIEPKPESESEDTTEDDTWD